MAAWEPSLNGAIPAEVVARIDSEVHHLADQVREVRADARETRVAVGKLHDLATSVRTAVVIAGVLFTLVSGAAVVGVRWAMRQAVADFMADERPGAAPPLRFDPTGNITNAKGPP